MAPAIRGVPRISAAGRKASASPLFMSWFGGGRVYVMARLEPSVDLISPGWILFEGNGVRKQQGDRKGKRIFMMQDELYLCSALELWVE